MVRNFVPQAFCHPHRAPCAAGESKRRGGHAGLRAPPRSSHQGKEKGKPPRSPRVHGPLVSRRNWRFWQPSPLEARGASPGSGVGEDVQDPPGVEGGRGRALAAEQPPWLAPVPCPVIQSLTVLRVPRSRLSCPVNSPVKGNEDSLQLSGCWHLDRRGRRRMSGYRQRRWYHLCQAARLRDGSGEAGTERTVGLCTPAPHPRSGDGAED